MTTPKDASGVYLSTAVPRVWTLPDLTAGARDTASTAPPSAGQPTSLMTYAGEAAQVQFKYEWERREGPVGHPGPESPNDSAAPPDPWPGTGGRP